MLQIHYELNFSNPIPYRLGRKFASYFQRKRKSDMSTIDS